MGSWFDTLFNATLVIGGQSIAWREVLGNAFGFASAVGGLRRRVWAWPIGIIGNVLLFTVFFGVWFTNPQHETLWGQAFRQIFFIVTSVYGWWRWRQSQAGRGQDAPAITPRWATARERAGYLLAWVAGVLVAQWMFAAIGAEWPAPRWYFWCDAWIFIGSIVATYAMARGWNDFWLAWIAVDLVGVPLLVHSHFYVSALLYVAYAVLVIYGFVVWLRASRRPERVPAPSGAA